LRFAVHGEEFRALIVRPGHSSLVAGRRSDAGRCDGLWSCLPSRCVGRGRAFGALRAMAREPGVRLICDVPSVARNYER
jgi:hypothetical protein